MEWLTQSIITLTPLSLGVIILIAIITGWALYGLRGHKHWAKKLHRYHLPIRRKPRKARNIVRPNYGYVEYVPEVVNAAVPRPMKRAPQIIQKQQQVSAPAPKNIPRQQEPIFSTKDDLQVVEGIGPKIEEILNSNGIYTWRELASTPSSNLEHMLERAGKRFAMHEPKTWPEQAKMADQAQWNELRKWQDELHGGIQVKKT